MGILPVNLRDLLTEGGVKDTSRLKLLRTIMARPGTQAYLSRRSGLSQGTVSDAVRDLEAIGYVHSDKDGRSKAVTIARTTGAAVGIELGFRYAAVVARRVEQSYDDAQVKLCSAGAAMGAGRWVEEVARAVRDAVTELEEEEIAAIGLGVPRVVDPQTGELAPPFMPPWAEGENPAEMLADELRSGSGPTFVAPRVVLDNDANVAAYAESIYGFENAVTLIGIKASTGIGAGIVIDGKIFRGARGTAGEIGHIVVDPRGRFCSCGGRGCLETVIGADALVEQARTVLGHRRMESPQDLEELVRMASRGNLACERVLREAATTLGFAIGNLCNILNPNVVVLSGAFGRAEATRFTLEPCDEAIRRSAMRAATDERLTVSATKIPHPAAHGALVVALDGTSYRSAAGRGRRR
ncbi:MAG TPA: ROK family transcriptional regulator [Steroidobacteraceae bacterium]|nr:ROK family transcriptional regulator [Steroidobacteraceae bacterium]